MFRTTMLYLLFPLLLAGQGFEEPLHSYIDKQSIKNSISLHENDSTSYLFSATLINENEVIAHMMCTEGVDYELMELENVKDFISINKYLPEIPSESAKTNKNWQQWVSRFGFLP